MPKGIPVVKGELEEGTRKMVIVIREVDYQKLEKLAAEQYRTAPLQAEYLLKQVLMQVQVGQADDTAAKILARAHARTNGEA